jgi:hypothetical protein
VVNKYIKEPEELNNSGGGPPTHGHKDKLTAGELANSESITARNPSHTETREMATKYIIKESEEDKNISGGGVRVCGPCDVMGARW